LIDSLIMQHSTWRRP